MRHLALTGSTGASNIALHCTPQKNATKYKFFISTFTDYTYPTCKFYDEILAGRGVSSIYSA